MIASRGHCFAVGGPPWNTAISASTGLKVSPLCLGAMMFGGWGNPDHEESIRIIHRALDAGINFIDTANGYSEGESEVIVGKALKDRREGTVLATKVWAPVGPGANQRGLSRKAIQEQVENSLRRLGTDVIDLYQIHRPDPTTPLEETLSALNDLVRQGKVRYLGLSTNHYEGSALWEKRFSAWEIVETLWISERHGWERFVSLQPPYSILRRTMELEHFPMSLQARASATSSGARSRGAGSPASTAAAAPTRSTATAPRSGSATSTTRSSSAASTSSSSCCRWPRRRGSPSPASPTPGRCATRRSPR